MVVFSFLGRNDTYSKHHLQSQGLTCRVRSAEQRPRWQSRGATKRALGGNQTKHQHKIVGFSPPPQFMKLWPHMRLTSLLWPHHQTHGLSTSLSWGFFYCLISSTFLDVVFRGSSMVYNIGLQCSAGCLQIISHHITGHGRSLQQYACPSATPPALHVPACNVARF